MNQTIKITDKSLVELNNVKNVISFNTHEFLLNTPYGDLKITGKDLKISKMDTAKEELIIKGQVEAVSYLHNKNLSKDEKESVFKKLFK